MKEKILVSACLLGINCKYNGKNNYCSCLKELNNNYELIPFCPEEEGGLPTPRVPSEVNDNKVINKDNIDVTSFYDKGAHKCLDLCLKNNIKIAILKEKSPSCGSNQIYDGTFTHTVIQGEGITTRLLRQNNIKVFNESNFNNFLK